MRGDDGSGLVLRERGADSVLRERGEDNGLVPSTRVEDRAGVRLNGGGGLAAGLRGDEGGELVLMERRVGGDASWRGEDAVSFTFLIEEMLDDRILIVAFIMSACVFSFSCSCAFC